jgi:hypothetical protein
MASVALATFAGIAFAQGQPAAPMAAQNAGFCGGRPLCFEANDFAATLLEFRTSESGGFKILDAALRFQNKTNRPIALGYADQSGFAIDDRGNRFGLSPWGGNGVRGMGIVSGNNIDPKFMLQPGGSADAHFELVWREGGIQGVSYELGMSIREINALEGNQFSLGSETPLDFQGLTPGMGAVPPAGATQAYSATQNPCGTTTGTNAMGTVNSVAGAVNSSGVQNTTGTATNQLTGAASTISNLSSMLHGNSAAAGTSAAAPCPASGYTNMGTSGAYGSQIINGAQQMMGTNPSGVVQQYGTAPQQYGTAPQQYGTAPQQYGTAPQQYGTAPQQYGTAPQQYGTAPQQYGTIAPATGAVTPTSQVKAVTTQPATGARVMTQPLHVVGQPVQATQNVRATTPAAPVAIKNATAIAPVQAKPSPAQPVKAVVKAPVVIPPKKPGTR